MLLNRFLRETVSHLHWVCEVEQRLVHLFRNLVLGAVASLKVHHGGLRVQLLELITLGRPYPRIKVAPQQKHWAGEPAHKFVDSLRPLEQYLRHQSVLRKQRQIPTSDRSKPRQSFLLTGHCRLTCMLDNRSSHGSSESVIGHNPLL